MQLTDDVFRALLEHSFDAIGLLNADGHIRYLTASIERLLGYAPGYLVGRDIFSLVHLEDQALIRERLRECVQRPGTGMTAEARLSHRDGTWRWMEGVATNLLHVSAVGGIVVNFRDVTERKRTEAALRERKLRLRLLLEQVPAVVWTTDRELRLASLTGVGLAAGSPYPDGLVGQPVSAVLRTDDPAFPALAAHRGALVGQAATYELRWDERYWHAFVRPLCNAAGEVVGTVGVAIDVTERREMARLDGALLVVRRVTHDLNNALAPLVGFSDLLAARPVVSGDVKAAAYLKLIRDSAQELAAKVRQLHQIVRLEEDTWTLGPDQPLLDLERSIAASRRGEAPPEDGVAGG